MTTDSTGLASENSEVSPVASLVAVAVMNCPTGAASRLVVKAKVPVSPLVLVVTCISPRKALPSQKPEASASGLLKNWMVKVLPGVLLRLPVIVVVLSGNLFAEVISGQFCSGLARCPGPGGRWG
jgi:hypothetical protein